MFSLWKCYGNKLKRKNKMKDNEKEIVFSMVGYKEKYKYKDKGKSKVYAFKDITSERKKKTNRKKIAQEEQFF